MLKPALEALEELKKELLDVNEYEMIDDQDNENTQLEKKIEVYTKICNQLLIFMFDPKEIVMPDRVTYGQNEAKKILVDFLPLKDKTKDSECRNKLIAIEQLLRLCSGEVNETTLQELHKHQKKPVEKPILFGYGRYIAAAAITALFAYNTITLSAG